MASKAKAEQPVINREIASTGDGRDITQPWLDQLKQPPDVRLFGAVDWGVYERIRKDDQVKSCIEQRYRAVVSAEWDVLPGDSEDARSVKAAEELKADLLKTGVDRWTSKMLNAIFYGYSVAELLWQSDGKKPTFGAIKTRHARRFRYDNDNNLRLLTPNNRMTGELLPQRNFWVVTSGGTNDDDIYGEGLADWLYWPTLFKRNGIRFWNIFLDKFAIPTAKATYSKSASKEDIAKTMRILRSMATDSGFAVPEGIAIEFLQLARNGVGDFKELCHYMDEAIAKIILSQTMTTQDGSSMSQARVHADVKLEVVKADADLICESFNEGPSRWWTDINYGPDVAAPQLARLVEEEADLKALAETDKVLAEMGYERTPESFRDTYGNGYIRAETKTKSGNVEDGDVVDLASRRREASFAEGDDGPDEIDKIVSALIAENGYKPLDGRLSAVINAIEGSSSAEDIDTALLQTLTDNPKQLEEFSQLLGRASFAVRMAAESGGE